jgi:hypothetical protein
MKKASKENCINGKTSTLRQKRRRRKEKKKNHKSPLSRNE